MNGRNWARIAAPVVVGIIEMAAARPSSALGCTPIKRPSRRTAIRSAMRKISSIRWLTNIIATLCWRRSLTTVNKRSTSRCDRAAVGSSMISTRAFSDKARAISTSCCSEIRKRPSATSARTSRPTVSSTRRAPVIIAAVSIPPKRSRGMWPM